MKKTLCLLLCLSLCVLSGCAGRIELTLMAVCLGVDADAAGVTLTVKSPDYTGDPQAEQGGYTTLSATGPDWERAVTALMESAPVPLHFGQRREVVIGEAALRYLPAEELLRHIDQLPSIRSHALSAVCPGTARDWVDAQKPVIGKRLSKYLDIFLQHQETLGTLPATSLAAALRDLCGPWRDPVLAWTEGGGYALNAQGQGTLLSPEEVQLLRLITGESQSCRLAHDGRYYTVSLRHGAERRIEKSGEAPVLVLRLPVLIRYSVYENPPAPGPEEALRAAAEALLAHLQAAGCDALGFGCIAVRDCGNLLQWLQSDWPEQYRSAAVRVGIDAAFRQQPTN